MVKTISNTPLLEGLRSTGSGHGVDVWVRAMGTVSGIELACGDRLIGPVDGTLVSLDAVVGDGRIEATASVATEIGGVPMTVSGVLVGGTAGVVHAIVINAATSHSGTESPPNVEPTREARDEQSVRGGSVSTPAPPKPTATRAPEPVSPRAPSAQTAEPRRSAASSVGAAAAAVASPPKKSVGWGDVAAVSAKVAAGALDDDDGEVDVDELDRGDTIDHPTLEKCVVVGVLGDDAVKVRLVNGSVRKLVMRGFRLYREGDNHFRIERKT
jgi:hypothetical protein